MIDLIANFLKVVGILGAIFGGTLLAKVALDILLK